jgi:hypothetical protein
MSMLVNDPVLVGVQANAPVEVFREAPEHPLGSVPLR